MRGAAIRWNRVRALTEWLMTIPGNPPFYSRPEFRFFADLTGPEFAEARAIMRRSAEACFAEAELLERELEKRRAARSIKGARSDSQSGDAA